MKKYLLQPVKVHRDKPLRKKEKKITSVVKGCVIVSKTHFEDEFE